ncbi:crotonase/enoyl-CoA hydratase family protein [Saccharopolyspora sp. K220]|uniref:crotonase/enoyl-CoA hydratase family protein n=1 Tax=Saccharopolyspora soli TaxID=2926618 RepID=UPI001F5A88A7|nr:crotonase/enoyl-CoA hydratase family protein [Saccharopolyspora soli]MCI2420031.1 crotonase/enoyl-CoA hydratase family protein [Saccharopolyspora soli]
MITTERRGPVLVVTLDRPKRRNAITLAMAEQVEAAMNELDTDPELRVGVLTGAGGYFCAGQDLAEAAAGTFAKTRDRSWFGLVGRGPAKPLVAAVEGFALAGGFEVVLACDLVVAARDARFGIPEIHNGQVAAAGGLVRLPLRLPYPLAAELALIGDPVDAATLHRHGLVNRLAEPGAALDVAVELASRVHANPPVAVRHTLELLRTTAAMAEAAGWANQNAQLSAYAMASTPEYAEGVAAFLDKRPPSWA